MFLVLDVLQGFATIWVVIGFGFLLAHRGVLDVKHQRVMGHVAYNVSLPALMFVTMQDAELQRIFSINVVVSLLAVLAAVAAYLVLAVPVWRRGLQHLTIGSFLACYVNAGNMGIPITAYVLHDSGWVAPILLIQSGLLQPIGLSMLESMRARAVGSRPSVLTEIFRPFGNPMLIGVLSGLLVNVVNLPMPSVLIDPLRLLSGAAVPLMLTAFGVSLRLGGGLSRGLLAETLWLSAIKLIWQPVVAVLLAIGVFHLDPEVTLAVGVLAGLPVAQNVFIFAMRFRIAEELSRNVIMITSIGSLFSVTALAAVLHALL